MTSAEKTKATPATSEKILDLYFLDARSKLIEIAAFLDRIDRSRIEHGGTKDSDYRLESFKRAVAALASDAPDKAKTIQMIFSDPTEAPLESAAGLKGATGAWGGKPRG